MLRNKILLKEGLLLLIEMLVIAFFSYYATRPENNDIHEKGLGVTLLLLFVICPLLSFLLGMLTEKSRILAWINAILLTILYLGLFTYFYNYTTYFYIPFYLMFYVIGLILRRISLRRIS
ncbi:hypothetical protein CEB3_c06840 [Peptococcaceae bacterium CEB3]|nr:hypothetical protein CEB3_c06840 [Peptococcaceae bacterium CEB3]